MASQQCFVSVVMARTRDKFKLCAVTDPQFQETKGQELGTSICRTQIDRILERMNAATDGYQSFDHPEVTYFVYCNVATITVVLAANKHVAVLQQLGPQAMQRAACSLLDSIANEFLHTYTADVIASASKPFQFIRFDAQMNKMIRRATLSLQAGPGAAAGTPLSTATATSTSSTLHHRDAAGASVQNPNGTNGPAGAAGNNPNQPGGAAYDTLKRELDDVQRVLKQNLDDILTRGERLETMGQYSSQLRDSSQGYYKKTVHINRMRLVKMYGPPLAICLLVVLWLWYYFAF